MSHSILALRARRAAAALCLLLAAATPASAQAHRSLEIRQFAAELFVTRNGSLRVKETITIDYTGEWQGFVRSIPVHYETAQGLNYRLRLRVRGVHDDTGAELRHELEREGKSLVLKAWVPGARDARRTIVLEYSVENALRFFDDHDELYWNVTGDESAHAIGSARADVYLPNEVGGIRTNAFTGPRGSQLQDATVEQVGAMTSFRTTHELGIREGLTVVVAWNPGVVRRPSAFAKAADLLAANSVFLLPLLAFGLMFTLWRRYGKDPVLGAIAPQYEPPTGMTPAEAGTLVDLRVDMRDLTATLVHLAVRGFIRIEETEDEHLFGLIKDRDYEFILLRSPAEFGGLKEHERDLLNALFENGERVSLDSLQNRFYKKLPGVTDSLKRSLVTDGYYVHSPNVVRGLFIAGAIASGVAIHAIGLWHAAHWGGSPTAATIAAALTGGIIALFGYNMPARTLAGTRTLRHVLGFEEFLERVESDRFERVIDRPELFEAFLPYAMAFGVEKRWAQAFESLCSTPPDWYHSRHGGPFRTTLFVADMGRMSSTAASTMRSSPRSSSSSSSGFGGGGFSGGGFGGGSVGGF